MLDLAELWPRVDENDAASDEKDIPGVEEAETRREDLREEECEEEGCAEKETGEEGDTEVGDSEEPDREGRTLEPTGILEEQGNIARLGSRLGLERALTFDDATFRELDKERTLDG